MFIDRDEDEESLNVTQDKTGLFYTNHYRILPKHLTSGNQET